MNETKTQVGGADRYGMRMHTLIRPDNGTIEADRMRVQLEGK